MPTEVTISPEVWDRLSIVIRYVESIISSDEKIAEKYRPIVRSIVFVRTRSTRTIAPYRWAGQYYELIDVHDRANVPTWELTEGEECDVLTIDNSTPNPGKTYFAVTIGQEVETSNPVVMLIGVADNVDESESSSSSASASHIGPFVTRSWTVCETDDYGNNRLVTYNERGIQYVGPYGEAGPVIYYDTVTI